MKFIYFIKINMIVTILDDFVGQNYMFHFITFFAGILNEF